MRNDPVLRDRLSEPSIEMPVRGGGMAFHAKESHDLYQSLSDTGFDVLNLSKKEILIKAAEFFEGKPSTAPVMEKPRSALVLQTVVPDSGSTSELSFEPKPSAAAAPAKKDLPFSISIYVLLVGALNLCDMDKTTGAEKRKVDLEKLAKEYAKAANL